jgi:calcineurin-like phosphoesterase family protein
MTTTFLISDTHFGHRGVCEFMGRSGTKLRPWTDADAMDEHMIQAWNARVGPKDKVYHLGDVVINRKSLATLSRLNGDKVLIKGNHDIFQLKDYAAHFRDIRAYHVVNGMILSHVPLHPSALYRFGTNIHGHLHDGRVTDDAGVLDPRYICVSVEQINYEPISWDEVQQRIRDQGGTIGFRNGNGPTM